MSEFEQKFIGEGGKVEVSLFPDDYRNDQFQNNLDFFKDFHPALYHALSQHKPKEYRICLNPDGTPNVFNMVDNTLVYEFYPGQDVAEKIRSGIECIGVNVSIGGYMFEFKDQLGDVTVVNQDPIQRRMRSKLYFKGPYGKDGLIDKVGEALPPVFSDYLPYVRVYGVGLGLHINELIRNKNISFISIYEPNIDLFYVSLYTISWKIIFQYFNIKQKLFSSQKYHINLYLGNKPEDVANQNKIYQLEVCRFLVLGQANYAHFSQEKNITDLMRIERRMDRDVATSSNNGWYEDQRAGFYFSAKNIQNNNKVFSGCGVGDFYRVFVVGSGPSLNDSISFIKNNREKAIVIACGSAMSVLINSGIIPDFQVVQERDWHLSRIEEYFRDALEEVILLKLNVVSTLIDPYYKDVFVFQKFNDPGSSLLGDDYAVTTSVNPTVTNSGIAFAAALKANEVYLFGVDYGVPVGGQSMHAAGSMYENIVKDGRFNNMLNEGGVEIEGAFSGTVIADKVLEWSLRVTESKIAESGTVKWFNVGDGARILGAESVWVDDLHSFSRQFNKIKIINKISRCFNRDYDSCAVINNVVQNAVNQVECYFDEVLSFSSSQPTSREDVVMVLTLMDRAMHQHKLVGGAMGALSYYPGFLLSGGIQELITNVFGQILYANDDQVASDFFQKAIEILYEYRNEVVSDMQVLVEHISADDDVDIKRSY
ncbi:MAG: motility associated factor glycosyltransferase family protein [Candidatus Scalindua sp.]|jgi:hypothetical protein|nr:motility associated factor glycosyltransferase family protein [Candidatus Scalindua sp.]